MKKIFSVAALLIAFSAPAFSLAQTPQQDCLNYSSVPSSGNTISEREAIYGTNDCSTLSNTPPTLKAPQSGGRDVGQTGDGLSLPNPLKTKSLIDLLGAIANFLLTISVVIGAIMVIYAGFLIVTSGGSPDKVTQGKKTILYVVIGLGIMLLFKVILAVIGQILGTNVNTNF